MDAATTERARQDVLDLIAAKNFKELAELIAAGLSKYGDNSFQAFSGYKLPNKAYGFDVSIAHGEGGHEGGGEYVERVIELKDGDNVLCYFQITGFYASNEGTEWNTDEVQQVFPREVRVIQFFDTPEA